MSNIIKDYRVVCRCGDARPARTFFKVPEGFSTRCDPMIFVLTLVTVQAHTKRTKGQNCAYALFHSLVHPVVRIMSCVQNILVFTTSAADMGKRLLLSKANI
jgi:hypothetical protein